MPVTILLDRHTHPLRDLTLYRVQLCRTQDDETLRLDGEYAIYSLIGSVQLSMMDAAAQQELGRARMHGRASILEPQLSVVRACAPHHSAIFVRFGLVGDSADLLVLHSSREAQAASRWVVQGPEEAYVHTVGTGAHQREVREMPVPEGFTLHVGETLNAPGGWSSYPSHCAPGERERWAEHEETFYVICTDYMIMKRQGTYVTGESVDDVIVIHNDTALAVPLGDHETVASPLGWGWYYWGYQSFLLKSYNQFAHHGVNVYVK